MEGHDHGRFDVVVEETPRVVTIIIGLHRKHMQIVVPRVTCCYYLDIISRQKLSSLVTN